jgi:PHD/YefM family antitoxin component YafN of YafNO toxin-antitoxin module
MSNYFQTLKRLESVTAQERAAPEPTVVRVETVERPSQQAEAPTPIQARVLVPAPAHKTPPPVVQQETVFEERLVGGFSSFFDNLRVLGNGVPLGSVVIAGASDFESTKRVADGLANEVIRNRLTASIAELSRAQSQPTLRMRMTSSPAAAHTGHSAIHVNTRRNSGSPELATWLDGARSTHDVVIIEAPPLGLSVDAAVVARSCDGLILVVEPRATTAEALQASVERADAVGCRILGIVTQGKHERLPLWLRQIMTRR